MKDYIPSHLNYDLCVILMVHISDVNATLIVELRDQPSALSSDLFRRSSSGIHDFGVIAMILLKSR